MDISVVIPAYNGGKTIFELFFRIRNVLSEKYSFEVLFIFDNGLDNTWNTIEKLRADYPSYIRAFHFERNYGQHRAIQFGLGKAKGDFIVTMDEDLQHDPADIIFLIEKQKEANYDIVYGKFNNLQYRGLRNIISTVLRKTLKHFIPTLYDNYSPYRLIRKEIALRTSTMICPYTFIDDYLSRLTNNIAFRSIDHYKRQEGGSSYTFVKLIKHGIFILLAYSRLIFWFLLSSIIFILAGLVMLIINIIPTDHSTGWPINDVSILVIFGIGGIQILLSLIGSFINHYNTVINTRPPKLIKDI